MLKRVYFIARYRTAGVDKRARSTIIPLQTVLRLPRLGLRRRLLFDFDAKLQPMTAKTLTVWFIPRLHDRANIEQTSSKCIQNTRANYSTFARRFLDRVNGVLMTDRRRFLPGRASDAFQPSRVTGVRLM